MYLFIDTDPGTDDLMALIYLLKNSVYEVVGMSSVFGNMDIDTTTRNLRLIAGHFNQVYGKQVEVFKGVSKPIINQRDNDASFYHGSDGCGEFFMSEYFKVHKSEIENLIESVQISNISEAMGMIQLSKKYNGELIVVAMGPLTNLALAQIIDPEFGSRLKEIFIMGGDLHGHGNSDLQLCAEFNFNKDPEAAYVVLKEIECKKTILPLEPNCTLSIKPETCAQWIKKLEPKQDLLANVMSTIIKFLSRANTLFKLYDLMLAILLVEPTVVKDTVTINVSVELYGKYSRGKIVYDHFNRSSKHHAGEFRPVNVISNFNSEIMFQKLNEFMQ